jgi:hypothetical protein
MGADPAFFRTFFLPGISQFEKSGGLRRCLQLVRRWVKELEFSESETPFSRAGLDRWDR